MPPNRPNLSKIASTAIPKDHDKLHAPSAFRNREAIIDAIGPFIPSSGKALEIASGTGEHVPRYAAVFPNIIWQPTDIEPDRLKSIAAHTIESGLDNILLPIFLDACNPGWAVDNMGQDVIILSNLLHLISEPEMQALISQAALALSENGVFLIYGPFMHGTNFASDDDKAFHESLQNKYPEIGYKAFQAVQSAQMQAELEVLEPINMPSNNFILVAKKK